MSALVKLDRQPLAPFDGAQGRQEWVPVRDVAARCNVAAITVKRNARTRISAKLARNGKPEREALVSSLPEVWQAKLRAIESEQRATACHLSEKQRARVAEIEAILAPMAEAAQCGHRLKDVAEQLAAQHGVSSRTIWQWWTALKTGGPETLARKARADRGESRRFKGCPELQRVVIAWWRGRGGESGLAGVARAVKQAWGTPLLPYEGKPPSYRAIRNLIESIPQSSRDAATKTQRYCMTKHAPYVVTLRGKYFDPNEELVGDERILDVLTVNERGEAVRLRVTAFQDTRTRAVRVRVAETANSRIIAGVLCDWIGDFGLPRRVRLDNGKDYQKIGRGAKRGSLLYRPASEELAVLTPIQQEVLARLGIEVSYCRPYHPQAKQIESFFSFLANNFDKLFFRQGYTGAKPGDRSDHCRELEKQHAEFRAGKREKSPLLPASYVAALLQQWVKEYNETWEHSGVGMDGRTPMQVMDELLPPAERRIPDMAALAPLFGEVAERKVENCKVQLKNATYSAALDDEEGQAAMYDANGGKVAVYFDPDNPRVAVAFENKPSGKLLATLLCDDLAGLADREQVQGIAKLQRKLFRASQQAMETMCAGVPSESELLAKRGGIEQPPPMRRLPPKRAAQFAEEFIQQFRKVE